MDASSSVLNTCCLSKETQPFRQAAASGNVDALRQMIRENPQIIDSQGERTGRTALHQAVAFDKPDSVMFLISQMANLTIRDEERKTAEELARTNSIRELFINFRLAKQVLDEISLFPMQNDEIDAEATIKFKIELKEFSENFCSATNTKVPVVDLVRYPEALFLIQYIYEHIEILSNLEFVIIKLKKNEPVIKTCGIVTRLTFAKMTDEEFKGRLIELIMIRDKECSHFNHAYILFGRDHKTVRLRIENRRVETEDPILQDPKKYASALFCDIYSRYNLFFVRHMPDDCILHRLQESCIRPMIASRLAANFWPSQIVEALPRDVGCSLSNFYFDIVTEITNKYKIIKDMMLNPTKDQTHHKQ